ncbi:MAG: preprotein translocase subunit YajC, partial [Actinomycetota bacterium]|nr:preprotein translocase subunit YajC [Actinomycetota bacterium]
MQSLPLFILFFVGVYFLLLRPQQQRVRRQRELMNAIGVGDRVVTAGGLIGRVIDVSDDRLLLEISDAVVVELLRLAVSRRLDETESVFAGASDDGDEFAAADDDRADDNRADDDRADDDRADDGAVGGAAIEKPAIADGPTTATGQAPTGAAKPEPEPRSAPRPAPGPGSGPAPGSGPGSGSGPASGPGSGSGPASGPGSGS